MVMKPFLSLSRRSKKEPASKPPRLPRPPGWPPPGFWDWPSPGPSNTTASNPANKERSFFMLVRPSIAEVARNAPQHRTVCSHRLCEPSEADCIVPDDVVVEDCNPTPLVRHALSDISN